MSSDLVVGARVTIPASDLAWSAVRSSGPGGQNVNKVSSKVELRFCLATTLALDEPTKERLRALAGNRLDADGSIVMVAQASRNQLRNLRDARERLAELIRAALAPPRIRRPTRVPRGAVRARLTAKRHRAETKRERKRSGEDER
ncbi:MAG: aminoacyl-tRNA hydrolase [Polyangiaceae bacterium]|nr:aminoacyl-tRNA hydrolase [Polyangiaceae bacterium]